VSRTAGTQWVAIPVAVVQDTLSTAMVEHVMVGDLYNAYVNKVSSN
jgi:hypothetical protein